MSKEHFNGSSTNNLAIILRLLPLTFLILMGSFLIFNRKPIELGGPWGLRSLGIGITILAIAEMISYQQRLVSNAPPSSPVPSDKTKYNQMAIIIVMIALSTLLGYTVAIRIQP